VNPDETNSAIDVDEETVVVPSSDDTTEINPAAALNRFTSNVVSIDRRGPGHTVFHIDESTFISTNPKTSHWSIAWADLMMTMFVLFLTMFIYKAADQQFLNENGQEIIGGDTTEALHSFDDSKATLPFPVVTDGLPMITAGTLKKIVPVPVDQLSDPLPSTRKSEPTEPETYPIAEGQISTPVAGSLSETEKTALIIEEKDEISTIFDRTPVRVPADTVVEPRPIIPQTVTPDTKDSFQEIYRLSKDALANNNLDKFAAIDIVPDKTMRIILTGDLLFALGQSELSNRAKKSLEKITTVLKRTPYMINVVGHTDNIPMSSEKFNSNWELSVARASTVARFLIDYIGMNPNQFVVSGYSSYRPTVPNNSAANRAKNRRVEVIISKRLPTPLPATPNNLN